MGLGALRFIGPPLFKCSVGLNTKMILTRLVFTVNNDCQLVSSLAKSLKMKPIPYNTSSCCSSTYGISCTNSQVTSIKWNSQELVGVFSGANLPLSLTTLDLSNNNISGSISFITNLPSSIQNLNFSMNKIGDTLQNIYSIPLNLANVDFSHNQISGILTEIPSGLVSLNISFNLLSGSLPALPSGITDLRLKGNNITGTVTNIPKSVQYLDLSDNSFWGSITAYNPKFFDISSNQFSSVSIKNTTNLLVCDISQNSIYYNQVNSTISSVCNIGVYFSKLTTQMSLKTTLSSRLFFSIISVTTIPNSPQDPSTSKSPDLPVSNIVYYLLGGIIFIFITLVVASKYVKHPKVHTSRFARKNSFATLQTVSTVPEQKPVRLF